jgi:catechol 2,3-dioxygenase-like lactoylglutathione lyase family enzyme
MASPAAGTVTFNHLGLHVSNIERSAAFYSEALGATWLCLPVVIDGPAAETAMGCPVESFRAAILRLGDDGALELFDFPDGTAPSWASLPATGRLPHLALQVADVPDVAERIEAAGGKRLWDEVAVIGQTTIIYTADPDGNVIELLDGPITDVAATMHSFHLGSRPAGV